MRLKLFEQFHEKPKTLYRNTDLKWLVMLLKDGHIKPNGKAKYISFSKSDSSGNDEYVASDGYDFGNTTVTFDAAELYKQGGKDVEYTTKFFKEHKDISMHVVGFSDEKDYMDGRDDDTLSWAEFIKGFSREKEVVLPGLKMKPGIVKSVTIWPSEYDLAEGDVKFVEDKLKLKAKRKDKE